MRILAAFALSLSLLLLPACAGRNNYLVNRGADLADIVRIHFMFGKGAGFKLEYTRLLHVGILATDESWAWGLHNREIGAWRESLFSWGVVVGHSAEVVEGIDYNAGSYGWIFDSGSEGGFFEPAPPSKQLDLDLLTARLTVMVGIGIDIEARVGEAIDFLVGIFQFDPSGDDRDYAGMQEPDLSGVERAPYEEDLEPAEYEEDAS